MTRLRACGCRPCVLIGSRRLDTCVGAPSQRQPVLAGRTDRRREDVVDLKVRHLVHHGLARTPLPGVPTVNRISSVVLRGVSHEGRLIGGGVRNQEPDGDTRRRDSDLDRFGPSDRCNTLCPMSLVYCIDLYVDLI